MLQSVNIQPGDVIKLSSKSYRVEEEIGSGGFGTVFRATNDGISYAIKLNRIWELLPGDREDLKTRIKLEYDISSSIHSEHIVHSYSYDEIFENPILVMDYCPDGSLRKKIGNTFSEEEIKKIVVQILSGLAVLHSYEIIHRDIKPENILFKKDSALLTDFGISANLKKRVTQRNIRGHALKVFATLSYSPPEQSQKNIAFKMTRPTNDVFSFGVVLYEMLTLGKLPFGDIKDFESDSRVVEERKSRGEWDVNQLKKHTSDSTWIHIIKKCLYPDPNIRFQSVSDILQVLSSDKPSTIQAECKWKLRILEGPGEGKEFNISNLLHYLNKKVLTIGRHDAGTPFLNDIPIIEGQTNYMSVHHGTLECIIKNQSPTWFIRDGQWYEKNGVKGWYPSRNGIKVNDTEIDNFGVELRNNDRIKMGKTVFRIFCE